MTSQPPSYRGYRCPPEIISDAVWLYHRFGLSVRDVDDLLAERGITVTYESIRQWCLRFGLDYARRLRLRRGRQGDTWHLDELFVKIQRRHQYLWQAVDEDGDVLDILVQSRRNRRAATSNKQLNFVQHVKSLLTIHGRAAVVVPDNALFEGGAGETVRKNLLKECDVHTLLRLPTGLFYAQGVKANVLFFDRKPGAKEPWTKTVWVYDLRTNRHFTLKTKRMTRADLDEFVECYRPGDRHNRVTTWSEDTPDGRWRPYGYDEITNRDKVSLDLFWLRDESLEDSANLPDPHILAQEIADDLRSALGQIEDVLGDLEARANVTGNGETP